MPVQKRKPRKKTVAKRKLKPQKNTLFCHKTELNQRL